MCACMCVCVCLTALTSSARRSRSRCCSPSPSEPFQGCTSPQTSGRSASPGPGPPRKTLPCECINRDVARITSRSFTGQCKLPSSGVLLLFTMKFARHRLQKQIGFCQLWGGGAVHPAGSNPQETHLQICTLSECLYERYSTYSAAEYRLFEDKSTSVSCPVLTSTAYIESASINLKLNHRIMTFHALGAFTDVFLKEKGR